jgi:Rad3-related DNA helicase
MNVAGSSDYEAGLKGDERFEQERRQAASSLLLLQYKARINQNKDLRNQFKGLIGEWLQIYSKKRWEETKCSEPTIEKMERDIAEGWKQTIGLLLTELQHQMSESTEGLEKELNRETKRKY